MNIPDIVWTVIIALTVRQIIWFIANRRFNSRRRRQRVRYQEELNKVLPDYSKLLSVFRGDLSLCEVPAPSVQGVDHINCFRLGPDPRDVIYPIIVNACGHPTIELQYSTSGANRGINLLISRQYPELKLGSQYMMRYLPR